MQVTARDLKLRLGRYLAAVRSGETVHVTRRGKLVAELRAVGPVEHERLAQLAADGRVVLGKEGAWPDRVPRSAARSATRLILEDRDERT